MTITILRQDTEEFPRARRDTMTGISGIRTGVSSTLTTGMTPTTGEEEIGLTSSEVR